MAQVEFKDIYKIYNENTDHEVKALNGINFKIEQGEFIAILGASGAGKSTLLNILGGMDRPSKGEFILNGKNINNLNDKELSIYRKDNIGFIFQFYNLMGNLTSLENVQIAESLSNNPLNSLEVLDSVGLKGRMNNFPSELSGGEQQRVSIARAIVKNPTLLLCDEPTGALDSKTGGKIIQLLKDVSIKYKKTVIIVTHNVKISLVANRVIALADGKIVSDTINSNPLDPNNIKW